MGRWISRNLLINHVHFLLTFKFAGNTVRDLKVILSENMSHLHESAILFLYVVFPVTCSSCSPYAHNLRIKFVGSF